MTTTTTDSNSPTAEAMEAERELKSVQRRFAWKRRGFEALDFLLMAVKAALALAIILALVPAWNTLTQGQRYDTVLTGSMSGTLEIGEMVVTRPYLGEELSVGTVVVINDGSHEYLHRIAQVNRVAGVFESYSTKGDANDTGDLFKPQGMASDHQGKGIKAVALRYIYNPDASIQAFFTLNITTAEKLAAAVGSHDWATLGALLPSLPYGLVLLIVATFIFWWFIPDLITHLQNKAEERNRVAAELLKKQVDAHEESLEEIEPVVEEFKEEKAKKEADEAAFKDAQAKAWDEFDPTAPIYDEPEAGDSNPFTEAYEEARPEENSVDDLLLELQQRHGTAGVTARARQSELPSLDASTPTANDPKRRHEASAFYLEEED